MDPLYDFLNENKVQDKHPNRITHVTKHPVGKYSIIDLEEKRKLFYLYNKALQAGCSLSLLELQIYSHIPVIIDIDLKSDKKEAPLYRMEHVENIVRVFQEVLREAVVELNEDDLSCFLLEKDPYYEIGRDDTRWLKNGFHLQFPQIFLSRQSQEKVILPKVIMKLKLLFSDNPDTLPGCVLPGKLIDLNIVKGKGTPWFLYGSSKGPNYKPYRVTTGFDPSANRVEDWTELLIDYPIYNRVNHNKEYILNHLPEIFSIIATDEKNDFFYKTYPNLQRQDSMSQNEVNNGASRTLEVKSISESEVNENLVDDLIEILEDMSEEFNDWIYMGWILYNIYNGSRKGFEKWDNFSKKCGNKYSYQVCCSRWKQMEMSNITLGTLKYLAKQKNETQYTLVMNKLLKFHSDKSLKNQQISHHNLATLLYLIYDNEFVCSDVSKNKWYHFNGNIWISNDDGVGLRNMISRDFKEKYREINFQRNFEEINSLLKSFKPNGTSEELLKKFIHNGDKKEEGTSLQDTQNEVKNYMKVMDGLESVPFKKNLMYEAKDLFYNPQFRQQLDANKKLIAFQNGVYNLDTFEFRKGYPSDYISLCLPYNYNEGLSMDHPEVKVVEEFFEKIFVNESIRNYFLDSNCFIFEGGNIHKTIQIWTGIGDNGKSVTQNLFERLMGPLCVKLPTSLIVGKRTQSSSASPELARTNGVRFCFLQEPSKNDVMNTGILKELSGNDSFYARALHSDPVEIQPQFKLALICNDPPKAEQSDQATWNRLHVIPFESYFTSKPPADEQEQIRKKQFPIDRHFDKKIPQMVEALAYLFLDRYKKLKDREIYIPDEVKIATEAYRNKNDHFGQFLSECVKEEEGSTISTAELFRAFTEWFREVRPHMKLPIKDELQEYLTKKWGRQEIRQVWSHKAIIFNNDDDE
jgi:P4 family phage/plasmid primase-like protien